MSNCDELGIPQHLHMGDRDKDPLFSENEILFRHFDIIGDISDWKKDDRISATMFPINNDSYNRSKYSHFADVLYDCVNGGKRDHLGIFSLPLTSLKEQILNHDKKERRFLFNISHEPLECNYAHSEIHVYENDQKLPKPPPRSIKILVRDCFLEAITILKRPDSSEV